ncbi:alpha/beta fold hydrolase [Methylobacterium haplocladii]|uniref:Arylesterase n=1 Tax=Methylobacterium haplocladii TaxID=1176176 RepID=A0A512IQH7_9HYPH|nr:alpha/beta hydrolase [Methylobacterium haplocladii]GEO99922.1 arylesterase [Methylobacterium haplocladii]GJD85229.1 Arylesterase [Methylobacterium haplocladii]GLS60981.1 arylesterase [Methylobacterium haplocladii]
MPTITMQDGTELYVKAWGSGRPVVLIHGWPLNADMWDYQSQALAEAGFRVIAYDRRGFGRSSQPSGGYDYDTFADDLAAIIEHGDLSDAVLVGFSMGGGEVARYIGRHGTARIGRTALVGAVPPYLLKGPDNPDGVDGSVFTGMKEGIAADRAQFFVDFGKTFLGVGRPGVDVSNGLQQWTLQLALQAGLRGTLACVDAFGTTDFRRDLEAFDTPTLVIHGDDDQVVPFEVSGRRAAGAIPGAELKVYAGAPHGLYATHKDRLSEDLIAFARG